MDHGRPLYPGFVDTSHRIHSRLSVFTISRLIAITSVPRLLHLFRRILSLPLVTLPSASLALSSPLLANRARLIMHTAWLYSDYL